MHVIFGARGVMHALNLFETFMQAQMWTWERTSLKTGKPEKALVQGALRKMPLGLYEYVFPEEHLGEVLNMLQFYQGSDKQYYSKNHIGKLGLMFTRKILGNGIKPIPKVEYKPSRFIPLQGIALYPIGIKYDKTEEKKEWGYKQEML